MTELSDDMLNGADNIAAFLGQPVRRVYYLLERKQLPAFKLGTSWHARRSTLLRFIAKKEGATAA